MWYHSFAGPARGTTDPEETHVYDIDGQECGLRGCIENSCSHTVIMWSGNEYSLNNTWIAAEEQYIVDLEEVR